MNQGIIILFAIVLAGVVIYIVAFNSGIEKFLILILFLRPSLDAFTRINILEDSSLQNININSLFAIGFMAFAFLFILLHGIRLTYRFEVAYLLLLLLSLITLGFSPFPLSSIAEWLKMVSGFGIFYLTYIICSRYSIRERILRVIVWSALPGIVLATYQFVTNTGLRNVHDRSIDISTAFGFSAGSPGRFSFFLLIIFPISIYLATQTHRNKFNIYTLISISIPFAAFITYTKLAWYLLFVYAIVYAYKNRSGKLLGAIVVSVFLLIYNIKIFTYRLLTDVYYLEANDYGSLFSGRVNVWLDKLYAFADSGYFFQMFGHGLASGMAVSGRVGTGFAAHSDFVGVLYEIGVLGLIIYVFVFASIGAYLLRFYRSNIDEEERRLIFAGIMSLLGYILISSGDNAMTSLIVSWYFWSIMGAVFGACRSLNRVSSKSHRDLESVR